MATLAFALGGAALGSAFGSAAVGWAVGSLLAQYLFAPGASGEGPRLDDLKITASTYGKTIPRVFGRMRVGGNIIYAEDIKEHVKKHKTGGLLSSTTYKEYSYTCTFAIALCEGPISGVQKIWANSTLIYDMSTPNGGATNLMPSGYVIYTGTETQTPNATLQAIFGDDIPAHRGMAYIVFPNMQLENYGNRIPAITAEVAVGSKQWPKVYDSGASYSSPAFNYSLGIQVADTDFAAARYKDGIIEVQWLNKRFNSYAFARSVQRYDVDSGALLTEDVSQSNTNEQRFDLRSAAFRVINRTDIWVCANDRAVGRLFPYQWMIGDQPLITQAAQASTGVQNATINQPDPNYIINVDGTGAGSFDTVAVWTGNYIISIGGREGYSPVYLQAHFAPDGTRALNPENTANEEIELYQTPALAPTWWIDVSDEAADNNAAIHFGWDTEMKYLYLGYRDVVNYNGFTSFPGVTGQPKLVKINPHTGEVLKAWYLPTGGAFISSFMVHKDKYIVISGTLEQQIVLTLDDNPYEPYTTYQVYSSANPVKGYWPTPIGEHGLLRVSNEGYTGALYTLASTLSSTTAELDDVVVTLCSTAGIAAADLEVTDLVGTPVNGYAINRQETTRASIETLQKGYIFDVVESDWKLKFKQRS